MGLWNKLNLAIFSLRIVILAGFLAVSLLTFLGKIPAFSRIWETVSGFRETGLVRTYKGHTRPVSQIAVLNDRTFMTAADGDGSLFVWAFGSKDVQREYEAPYKSILDIKVAADGQSALLATPYGITNLDFNTIRLRTVVAFGKGRDSTVRSVAIQPGGGLALVGANKVFARSGDLAVNFGTVSVWSLTEAKKIRVLAGIWPKAPVLSFSPDGQRAIAAAPDSPLQRSFHRALLLDAKSWSVINEFSISNIVIYGVKFSPDSRLLATVPYRGAVQIRKGKFSYTGRSLSGHSGEILEVAFSRDGVLVAAGGSTGAIWLWNVKTGKLLKTFSGHDKKITALAFAPGGRYLISGGAGGAVKLWNVSGQVQAGLR